ncbi:hypothetical protein QUF80_12965 [Desulfococcaceae bacterium HSG8]|nr:hypothetical protein [Desulfococcaceae bacterium HSG8]
MSNPRPYMLRICQSEPSNTLVARGGLPNPPPSHGSDLPIRTEQLPGCSLGIDKSPALTWFGFANPNRATL